MPGAAAPALAMDVADLHPGGMATTGRTPFLTGGPDHRPTFRSGRSARDVLNAGVRACRMEDIT